MITDGDAGKMGKHDLVAIVIYFTAEARFTNDSAAHDEYVITDFNFILNRYVTSYLAIVANNCFSDHSVWTNGYIFTNNSIFVNDSRWMNYCRHLFSKQR